MKKNNKKSYDFNKYILEPLFSVLKFISIFTFNPIITESSNIPKKSIKKSIIDIIIGFILLFIIAYIFISIMMALERFKYFLLGLNDYYFLFILLIINVYWICILKPKNMLHLYTIIKQKYPDCPTAGIILIIKMKSYLCATITVTMTGFIYYIVFKIINNQINKIFLIVLICLNFIFIFSQKLIKYRIVQNYFGKNEFEARQIISFIKNKNNKIFYKKTKDVIILDCYNGIVKEFQDMVNINIKKEI